MVFVDYLNEISRLSFNEWDVSTITAGDYTVEFDVSENFYENFMRKNVS